MLDNAPITGGCHYPWDCSGYQTDCTNCPAIVEKEYLSKATENLAIKQKQLPQSLAVIACSEGDYQRAKSSSLCRSRSVFKKLVFISDSFKPGNKVSAKEHFNFSPERKVIFFGASKMNENRKGLYLLVQAFATLQDYIRENEVILLCAGQEMPELNGMPIKQVGFLSENELIQAYQAADVFVCPSIEDSGPLMINQSIICGTPVVAFETGVASDLVITGETGYRAIKNDHVDLAEGIRQILELSSEDYKTCSRRCREIGMVNSGNIAFRKFCDEILMQH